MDRTTVERVHHFSRGTSVTLSPLPATANVLTDTLNILHVHCGECVDRKHHTWYGSSTQQDHKALQRGTQSIDYNSDALC